MPPKRKEKGGDSDTSSIPQTIDDRAAPESLESEASGGAKPKTHASGEDDLSTGKEGNIDDTSFERHLGSDSFQKGVPFRKGTPIPQKIPPSSQDIPLSHEDDRIPRISYQDPAFRPILRRKNTTPDLDQIADDSDMEDLIRRLEPHLSRQRQNINDVPRLGTFGNNTSRVGNNRFNRQLPNINNNNIMQANNKSAFPKTLIQETTEEVADYTSASFDLMDIERYDSGGLAFGQGTYQLSKNDEAFIKASSNIKFTLDDNFITFMNAMKSNAVAYHCTARTFKSILFNNISGSAKDLVADMIPMSTGYLNMNAEQYINALRLKLAPRTEKKLLEFQFKKRKQEPGESPKYYLIDLLNLYKRAHPKDQRNLQYFCSKAIKGLSNEHMKKYALQHLDECTDEVEFQTLIEKASADVVQRIEVGLLPKSSLTGVDLKVFSASYKDNKNDKSKSDSKVNVIEDNSGSDDTELGTSDSQEEDSSAEVNNVSSGNRFSKTRNKSKRTGSYGQNANWKSKGKKSRGPCFYCNIEGHWKDRCLKRKRDLGVNSLEEMAEFSDSAISEIEEAMECNAIRRKTGRKAVYALARRPRNAKYFNKSNSSKMNQVQAPKTINNIEDPAKNSNVPDIQSDKNATSRMEALEHKINSITDLLADLSINSTDSFLGKGENPLNQK